MDLNKIPWTTNELIDYATLLAATLMVTAFPVFYAMRAQLRDRLAVVIILATGATALAFILTAILWPLRHAGVVIPDAMASWLARFVYLSVGLGKLLLLWTLRQETRRNADAKPVRVP